MVSYKIINLSDYPQYTDKAAKWFHNKWGIPQQEYKSSIINSFNNTSGISSWYICISDDEIIAGIGVIENDFHNRIDLTPNLCALYVEENFRLNGISSNLVKYVCNDLKSKGIKSVYLVTDIDNFYEKLGFKFYTMVKCINDEILSKLYILQL